MRTLLCLTLIAFPALADEVVMKDGKKIELVAYRDLGESVEVENKDGLKLEIKKSDIARIELKSRTAEAGDAAKAGAALTGATFTFDKKVKLESFDLLKSLDLKKDVVRPTWKMAAGSLTGDGGMLETSYVPPAEYDLTMVVERTVGTNIFSIGLVSPEGKQFVYAIDGTWNELKHGSKPRETSGYAVKEDLFPKNKGKRTLQFMVRKYGILIKVDGKEYTVYKEPWSNLWPPIVGDVPTKKNVFFFVLGPAVTYKIDSAVVTFPKE